MFYELTKFHWLIVFTWNIGQYVYCNWLFPRLWRHKFEINIIFLIKTKKSGQKFRYLENDERF